MCNRREFKQKRETVRAGERDSQKATVDHYSIVSEFRPQILTATMLRE